MQTFISFILVFGSVVLFHEWGHFIVAKLSGIRVNEFAIGMGPQLLKYKGKETLYSLRLFPIGGFVSMEGESEASEDTRSFQKKSPLIRMAVVVAGPLMNFVLAMLLFMVIAFMTGVETTEIGLLVEDKPAIEAGFIVGDKIVAINKSPIEHWSELTDKIANSGGQTLIFDIERENQQMEITVTPELDPTENRYMIGIQSLRKHTVGSSLKYGYDTTIRVTGLIIDYIPKLFQGTRFVDEVVGPVGIVVMIGEASRTGLVHLIGLAALISVNLGLMNLLPIPALDGGRVLFLAIELALRKPIKEEWEANIHKLGFVLLIGLTIVIFIKDIFTFWQ